MARKFGIALGLVALGLAGWFLWTRLEKVDLDMASKITSAEDERHGYVVSHDFSLLKEALVNAHRDLWVLQAQQEEEARMEATLLVVMILAAAGSAALCLRPRNAKNSTLTAHN